MIFESKSDRARIFLPKMLEKVSLVVSLNIRGVAMSHMDLEELTCLAVS